MHPEVSAVHLQNTSTGRPRLPEILCVFLLTYVVLGFGLSYALQQLMQVHIKMVGAWVSHIPMMLVPYIWYRVRVARTLPDSERLVWTWREGQRNTLYRICIWYVPIVVLLNLSSLQTSFHTAFGSAVSAVSVTLFQCVFVGISEEMMVRPALHLPLSKILTSGWTVGRVTLSYSTLMTAAIFGAMHIINIAYQPVMTTLFQAVYAFLLALLFGYYYQQTRNYLGTAVLHGVNDGVGPVLVLISAGVHHLT